MTDAMTDTTMEHQIKAAGRKAWGELSDSEKIERLRDVLRSKEMALSEMRETIAKLAQHSHDGHGGLTVPFYLGIGQGSSVHFRNPLD